MTKKKGTKVPRKKFEEKKTQKHRKHMAGNVRRTLNRKTQKHNIWYVFLCFPTIKKTRKKHKNTSYCSVFLCFVLLSIRDNESKEQPW